jgi:hypothetical protein
MIYICVHYILSTIVVYRSFGKTLYDQQLEAAIYPLHALVHIRLDHALVHNRLDQVLYPHHYYLLDHHALLFCPF